MSEGNARPHCLHCGRFATPLTSDEGVCGRHGVVRLGRSDVYELLASRSFEDENGCWVWDSALNQYGYGFTKVGDRTRLAHRLAYEFFVGPIPTGMQLDHLCRNRRCWRFDHLDPVTSAENTRRSPLALATINAAKTHCIHGHPLNGDNLKVYIKPDGNPMRQCLTCRRRWAQDRAQRERTAKRAA